MWGHGSGWMMGDGSGWGGSGWMMIFGGLFWLVLLALGVAGVMWFVGASRRRGQPSTPADPPPTIAERNYPPLEILEQRYTRGDINRTEYLEKKDDLLRRGDATPAP